MNRETLVRNLVRHTAASKRSGILCECGEEFPYSADFPSDPRTRWALHVTDVIYPRTQEYASPVRDYCTCCGISQCLLEDAEDH